ncbi:protoglobin domain-containing protein [Saprospira sp. CCB-QB6]|uniref:protoglobin domain-containing protein n=1 Tax=Saprospira sp. CCB-QB6 TaxID=3023936 RepID=UPI00234BFC96|nr:protoglobin domain-containing protein [Saprospira sp. CCB-QB6]WCL81199.1 protoglobin domain-containing protein [Saprospira sp. CCB-QB6]
MQTPKVLSQEQILADDMILHTYADLMLGQLPQIIDQFYDQMLSQPDFEHFFTSDHQVKRLKSLHKSYWTDFWTLDFDAAYQERRKSIGLVHARIGLPLKFYFEGMVLFGHLFREVFRALSIRDFDLLEAFHMRIEQEIAIIVDSYNQQKEAVLEEENRRLAAPLSQIWDDILFLPLVGILHKKRLKEVIKQALHKVSEVSAKVFILDIKGLQHLQLEEAKGLLQLLKAVQLMGCKPLVSGISPIMAQTLLELDIQLKKINAQSSMKDALSKAYAFKNLKLVNIHELAI